MTLRRMAKKAMRFDPMWPSPPKDEALRLAVFAALMVILWRWTDPRFSMSCDWLAWEWWQNPIIHLPMWSQTRPIKALLPHRS